MFQPGNGERPNAPNYLVILTDGKWNNETLTWNEAMKARGRGISIIAVSNLAYFTVFFAFLQQSLVCLWC